MKRNNALHQPLYPVRLALSLGTVLLIFGCAQNDEPIIPLYFEAVAHFDANHQAISALADKLESDDDIQSLDCTARVGVQMPTKGISRVDGSTVSLSQEKIGEYRALVKDAHICGGNSVRGGIIFDLFEIEAPNFVQSVQLLRVKRDGDDLCTPDRNLSDGDWCVLPLNDQWQLAYSWHLRW